MNRPYARTDMTPKKPRIILKGDATNITKALNKARAELDRILQEEKDRKGETKQ